MTTRTLVVLAGLSAIGGVVADDNPTAERLLGTTTAEPGETVPVSMTLELSEAGTVDYVDSFSPAFAGAEDISITEGGGDTASICKSSMGRQLSLSCWNSAQGRLRSATT